ncbi:MAG: hypothetical protein M1548_06295 [Actinobacteria bacterium]|nr:hypothetical protein [Actinomycetota bacterium]
MNERHRLTFILLTGLAVSLLALAFGAGAYIRDAQEFGSPERVVRRFFAEVRAQNRAGALSFWSLPADRRESFGDLDVKLTEDFLRDARKIRAVEIKKLDYLSDSGAISPANSARANIVEVSGYYLTDNGQTNFRLMLRDINQDIPLLEYYGRRWRLSLAEIGQAND